MKFRLIYVVERNKATNSYKFFVFEAKFWTQFPIEKWISLFSNNIISSN